MSKESQFTTFELVFTAVLIALTVLSARLNLAIGPIPITLQSLVIILSGILLGPKRGWLVPALYLGMGLIGLPFFSAGGGLGYLFKPTFGFLIGFIPAAWCAGAIYKWHPVKSKYVNGFISTLSGMIFVYLFGLCYIPFGAVVYGNDLAVWSAILPLLPFMIFGDLLKALVITFIAPVLVRELKTIESMFRR